MRKTLTQTKTHKSLASNYLLFVVKKKFLWTPTPKLLVITGCFNIDVGQPCLLIKSRTLKNIPLTFNSSIDLKCLKHYNY